MRFARLALGAVFLLSFGCQTNGGGRYAVNCKIVQHSDGTKWEDCENKTETQIRPLCAHDEKGRPFEVEGNEEDIYELMQMNPKNYVGHCNPDFEQR